MATVPSDPGVSLVSSVLQQNTSDYYDNTTTIFDNMTSLYDNITSTVGNGTSDNGAADTKMFFEYTEFKIADFLNKYYLYMICAIGIPGNIASMVTLSFMKPLTSSSVFMLALAAADLFSITITTLYVQLTDYDVQMGDIGCQVVFLFGSVSQQYSNWILVSMTIERFIAIWFPFKVNTLCSKRNACLTLLILFIFLVLANLQFVFTFEEAPDPQWHYECRAKEQYEHFASYVWYWIDGLMYGMLPVLIIVVFNGLIIFAIRRQSRAQRSLTSQSTQMSEKMAQQRQVTVMLITISVVFVMLVLPNCIFFTVRVYWEWKGSMKTTAQYYLALQIVFCLSGLNHAVNFYLYCLSGRKFRHKFFEIICCGRCSPRSSTIRLRSPHPAATSKDGMSSTARSVSSMPSGSLSVTALSSVSDTSDVTSKEQDNTSGDVKGGKKCHM